MVVLFHDFMMQISKSRTFPPPTMESAPRSAVSGSPWWSGQMGHQSPRAPAEVAFLLPHVWGCQMEKKQKSIHSFNIWIYFHQPIWFCVIPSVYPCVPTNRRWLFLTLEGSSMKPIPLQFHIMEVSIVIPYTPYFTDGLSWKIPLKKMIFHKLTMKKGMSWGYLVAHPTDRKWVTTLVINGISGGNVHL